MKKLTLKKLNLETSEVFTREQLKNVLGGAGSGSYDPYVCYSGCYDSRMSTCMAFGGSGPGCVAEASNFCENACFS
ncbi:hypothetical protein [Solitalea lacus]|uniref:hypothetical protein n=1 Tax=Solitalea lacus TaxID=2911172 RepID=UPI001EDB40DF|nr:hypothetical protein [Solitalea lacus]UKJ07496.1 hypothetical protein L2B55_18500 [Solitalea lacus]